MKKQTYALIGASVFALAVLVYWWMSTEQRLRNGDAPPARSEAAPGGARTEAAPDPRAATKQAPPKPGARPLKIDRIDAETRAKLLRDIAASLQAGAAKSGESQGAAGGEEQTDGEAPPRGKLDKEYIRASIKEIVPLIKECYELALEERPKLDATVVVEFTIEGAEDLGGVISSSKIPDPDTETKFPVLAECVRETMYAIRISAPEGGGIVTVRYPFKFSSGKGE